MLCSAFSGFLCHPSRLEGHFGEASCVLCPQHLWIIFCPSTLLPWKVLRLISQFIGCTDALQEAVNLGGCISGKYFCSFKNGSFTFLHRHVNAAWIKWHRHIIVLEGILLSAREPEDFLVFLDEFSSLLQIFLAVWSQWNEKHHQSSSVVDYIAEKWATFGSLAKVLL